MSVAGSATAQTIARVVENPVGRKVEHVDAFCLAPAEYYTYTT